MGHPRRRRRALAFHTAFREPAQTTLPEQMRWAALVKTRSNFATQYGMPQTVFLRGPEAVSRRGVNLFRKIFQMKHAGSELQGDL